MDFKKASINGVEYGKWIEPGSASGNNFEDIKKLEKESILMMERLGALGGLRYNDNTSGFIDWQSGFYE